MTWWQIYLALLPTTYKNNLVIDLMRSSSVKYFLFENTYYFYMWVVLWVTTFILSPYLFFIIVAGSAMWYIGTCIVNVVSHSKGSKQFDDAVAYNNTLVNLLTGVGNHNNHHKYPGSFTYGVKGEFDAYGLLIDKVFSVN
jgi:fatty-acid desaturase